MSLRQEIVINSPLVEKNIPTLDSIPTDFTVILGYHGSPADMPMALKPLYDRADVVLSEAIGWLPEQRALFDKLSFASNSELGAVKEEFAEKHFYLPKSLKLGRLIVGSGARYNFWDITTNDEGFDRLRQQSTLGVRSLEDTVAHTKAVLERDEIALSRLSSRISEVDRGEYKSQKRAIIVHAGLSHLLLYNGIRRATEKSRSSLTQLVIPFEDEETQLLKDQTPEVQLAAMMLAGNSPSESFLTDRAAFEHFENIGEVPKARTDKYAKAIWQLVAQRTLSQ